MTKQGCARESTPSDLVDNGALGPGTAVELGADEVAEIEDERFTDGVKDLGAALFAGEEVGLVECFELLRDIRLRGRERRDDVIHRGGPLPQQLQDRESGRLGENLEKGRDLFEGLSIQFCRLGHLF